MHAKAKKSVYPTTTANILETAAEMPLYARTDLGRLALEPVSSRSLWGDKRWVFDNPTIGSRYNQSTISWDLSLPDGNNLLDPLHADLLDWLRRLVWSAFAAPGDGSLGFKPGSLGSISVGLRFWVRWLVEHEIAWPHELDSVVVTSYQEHLQDNASNGENPKALTIAQASKRLLPLGILWRQRFALERAGIAPMPAAPFGRAGVKTIANKIAAVGAGSYRPLPDEVAIRVLNTAMTMLQTPASDVISLAEACAASFASAMAEKVGTHRRRTLASCRQRATAKAFRFTEVDGKPWHASLDPSDWDQKIISAVKCKLEPYLESRQAVWRTQLPRRPTLPFHGESHNRSVDIRQIAIELGLQPGDEQLLCRCATLNTLINNVALEQFFPPLPLIGPTHRLRQLIIAVRSAAHIVIQATTGMRISEICGLKAGIDPETGLPFSVEVQESLNGLSEVFILTSCLSKTEDTPRAVPWILGYRPKGSMDLPPAVQAIIIVDRLLAPWRAQLGIDDLFVSFKARSGLPKALEGICRASSERLRVDAQEFIAAWVDLSNLPDEAARKTMDKELTPYRKSHGRVITTHQLRKTFGYFASNIDRRLLPMLQMNFHHVSAAMTDGAYTGNPVLERDASDVRYQNLALESLEIARGGSGMAGRYGYQLEKKIITELGTRITGLSTEDAYLEAFIYVDEAGLDRLYFEPYGICGALSASEMACHEAGGTTDLARWEPRLAPNFETRHPSLCAGCACFAIARRHLPYWETRYIDNASQLLIFEALERTGPLVDGALALTQAQAQQASAVCNKLGSNMDELERRLAAEVRKALNAA